jgi:transposase
LIAETVRENAMTDDGLRGLTPIESRKPAGIMPNKQHQTAHGFMTGAPYELAIVEFDDQGRCYDRGQMDGVTQRLEALERDLVRLKHTRRF